MRPINRGDVPMVNGVAKVVSDYKDWRSDLIDRIGNYCSYCNMVLNDSPQVEHVVPKNPPPGQVAGALLAWDNMVLACGPCNRAKSNNPNSTATSYIPDYHNTHLAFLYVVVKHPNKKGEKACIVVPNSSAPVNISKAKASIKLCALDKVESNKRATDLRWKYRYEAWRDANLLWRESWDKWGKDQKAKFLPLLASVIKAKGFFSIWYEAFKDDADARQTVVEAFPNTCTESFTIASQFQPQIRVAGDL